MKKIMYKKICRELKRLLPDIIFLFLLYQQKIKIYDYKCHRRENNGMPRATIL